MGTPGRTTVDTADVRTLISSSDQQGGIYGDLPGESMRMPVNSQLNIGDANGADIQEMQHAHEAKWPQSARDEHKANGGYFAGPGTSFPLKDGEDVAHAAGLYGHADNKSKVKANIISWAKRNGFASKLPKAWTEEMSDDCDEDPQIQEGHSEIRQLCRIIESQALNTDGHEVRVTIIKEGKSANSYSYDPMAMQTIAQMIEGAQAYADHGPPDQTVRSVRDIVGFYHNAQYIPPSGISPGRVEANLHIMENAGWLWDIIKESFQAGNPNLIGLSIDIFGQYQFNQGLGAKEVTRVVSLNSCDIVTRPSAGGSFQRILHDQRKGDNLIMDPITQDPPTNNQQQQQNTPPADQQNQNQTPPTEQQTTPPAPTPQAPPVQAPPQQIQEAAHIQEQMRIFEEQQKEIAKAREDMQKLMEAAKMDRAQVLLERRLQESILPEAVRKQVKSRFEGRIFEEDELNKELQNSLDMLASLTQAGIVRGHNYDKAQIIGSQITEAEKIQAYFDKMFDLDIDPKFGNIKAPRGIREAYTRVTGDSWLSGGITGYSKLGNIKISEHSPLGAFDLDGERIMEADTTTASFSYLLGTSMNKRLLKDYQAWPAEWQKFVIVAPIRDFKQQTRVRLGAFGSLSVVPEDAAYTSITLQDSAATYVAQKRGNLVAVSRETIINDDLQAIKQIPTKLAVAAAYTLAEFVYAFLSTNPTIYDGSALFLTGSPHTNLGTSALSSAAMQTGVTAMREQTNFAGKRIGLRPRFLIVPPELEWVAMQITRSAGVPGSANNDINPMMGYCTPIVSPQLSNTTQWYMACDPRENDTLEIGFVGGQVNPALKAA